MESEEMKFQSSGVCARMPLARTRSKKIPRNATTSRILFRPVHDFAVQHRHNRLNVFDFSLRAG